MLPWRDNTEPVPFSDLTFTVGKIRRRPSLPHQKISGPPRGDLAALTRQVSILGGRPIVDLARAKSITSNEAYVFGPFPLLSFVNNFISISLLGNFTALFSSSFVFKEWGT
jgi:hypothetical protein